MRLTDEQRMVVASDSEALRVVAFAGAGKTSTLRAYAQARPDMRFLYLAFNRAIKQEAEGKFPSNVYCVTTHALAYRNEGHRFRHKLVNSVRANQAAKALGIDGGIRGLIRGRRALGALTHFLASPYYGFDEFRRADVDEEHSANTLEDAERLWEAMIDPGNDEMPMLHDGYLKLYQLSNPKLKYDCILFDEAQDANPVTLEIVRTQDCRKVFVGDPHQQIYQFRRATNAMDDPLLKDTLYLTESFRFGSPIATTANAILSMKREAKRVRGGRTSPASETKAYLARGNAAIFTKAASMARAGKGVYFVGGIDGYRLDLLLDVWSLWQGDRASIKDLFIRHFQKYSDLAEYAESQNERDLMAWVNVIKKHQTPESIPYEVSEVRRLCVEEVAQAELCVATAHKSKGLEFGTVEIAEDFPKPKLLEMPKDQGFKPEHWQYGPRRCPSLWEGRRFRGGVVFPVEEINLRYVAATRAERLLLDSAWKEPDHLEILRYLNKYPDFLLVDDERQLVKKDEPSQEDAREVKQEQHQSAPIEEYGWVAIDPVKERIKKAVDDFKAVWPQWSWDWFAQESTEAAARNESPATVVSRIAKTAGMAESNPALKNFLVSCGILKKGGAQPELPTKEQGGGTDDGEEGTTLTELVYAMHGERVSSRTARFNTKGWFSVGLTKASCPRCAHGQLEGFRKPYKNSRGDLYHYWGLYCAACNSLHEPSDLSGVSQKALKAGAIPLNTTQDSVPAAAKMQQPAAKPIPEVQRDFAHLVPPDELMVGAKVQHWKWGRGVVTSLEGDGESKRADVRFERAGLKKLQLSLAKLSLLY